jgi:TRAP-type C4-dicarboxylate transport system substrate-binding protein
MRGIKKSREEERKMSIQKRFFRLTMWLSAFIFIVSVAVIVVGSEKLVSAQTFNLRLAMNHAKGEAQPEIMEVYCSELEKRTNGGVKVQIFLGGVLGSLMDSLRNVSSGTVDMTVLMGGIFRGEMPLTTTASLPMATFAPDTMQRGLYDLYNTYPPYKKEWEERNKIRLIGGLSTSAGFAHTRMRIDRVEDFVGKKIRAFGLMNLVMKKIGGTPVMIPSTEVYEALSKGVIDGNSAMPFDAIGLFKLYEVSPYVFDWGVGQYASTTVAMSMATWNKLPAKYQKIINDMQVEYLDRVPKMYNEIDDKFYKAMKANPKTVLYKWAPEEIEKARKMVVPAVWDEYIAGMEKDFPAVPTREFWEKLLVLMKKYEKVSKYVEPVPFVK